MSRVCDLCGAQLGACSPEISPKEMRIIAGNGYGMRVPVWPSLSPEDRRRKLYQIAIENDTAWAVCPDCYRGTRGYAEDHQEGPSHEQFREMGLGPLLDALQRAGKQVEPEARGAPAAADSDSGRTLSGHTERVMSVAISPDGRRVLSSGWDQTVRLWDAETCAELQRFTGHTGFVDAVAFAGNARSAVSAGAGDYALRVWDCESGRQVHRLSKHSFTIHQLSVSADGRTALTASGDGTARVWDLEGGSHVRKLGGFFGGTHGDAVTAAAISPDGSRALTGSLGKEVKFWDVAANRVIHTFQGFPYGINHLGFHPDGRRALAIPGHEPRALDLTLGRDEGRFPSGLKSWDAFCFSADGRHIVVAENYDGLFVRVLDANTGQQIRSFEGHTKGVTSVAISADGRRVVSGSDDWSVRVWDM